MLRKPDLETQRLYFFICLKRHLIVCFRQSLMVARGQSMFVKMHFLEGWNKLSLSIQGLKKL